MAKIVINEEQLNNIKGSYLGEGREGKVYYFKDQKVLKIYHKNNRPEEIKFTNKNSPYISFPEDIFVDSNGNILASSMNYFAGIKLNNGFPEELEINKLKEAYDILLEEIKKFDDIYMADLCLDNILYNIENNRFYIIDTFLWQSWDDSFGLNYARLDLNLGHALYQNISWLKEYDFINDNKELLYYFNRSKQEDFLYFLKYLDLVVLEINKQFNKDIQTIGDLNSHILKKH